MMIFCNYSSRFIEFNNNIMTIIVIKIIRKKESKKVSGAKKRNCKDVKQENSPRGTNGCRIMGKCSKELG